MQVLIVDHVIINSKILESFLDTKGDSHRTACNATEALLELDLLNYDIVIMDLNLPDMDGLELLRKIRYKFNTPVIIYSEENKLDIKLAAFNRGIDDYIVRPCSLEELYSRMKAVYRRHTIGDQKSIHGIDYFGIEIDLDNKTVKRNGEKIEFTKSEYDIFELLFTRLNKLTTLDIIMDSLYNYEDPPGKEVIPVFIHKIRKKIGKEVIMSVRQRGYVINTVGP